jgi:hypothetical protein
LQGESDASGANEGRRSSTPFDPVAGMRAMAEIQAEGLRAASELLERVLQPAHNGTPTPARPLERDYSALVDAWVELLQRFAAGLARPADPGPVRIPIDAAGAWPPLRLALERPEEVASATAEIWLHNGTAAAVGPLALRCGSLTTPNGTALDGVRVRFDPPEVALLPPRSSRGVVVSLDWTEPPRPGFYRGTIQAEGAPNLWLPVEVAVGRC